MLVAVLLLVSVLLRTLPFKSAGWPRAVDSHSRTLALRRMAQEEALRAAGRPVPETQLGVFVIHNKQRPKLGALPEGTFYFVAKVGGAGQAVESRDGWLGRHAAGPAPAA